MKIDLSDFPLYASSRMTYARLALPMLLADIGHVIYADVDMLWLDDISILWGQRGNVDLISCVRERSEKTLDMEEAWFVSNGFEFDREKYFCAGVSFYNLSAIRESRAFDKVFDFGRRYKGFNCADQSMVFGAIGDKVGLLPDRWQTFPRNGVKACPGEPMVLHYAGEAPWKCTHYTWMMTDTQLLWFMACAQAFDESVWRSLRRFYSTFTILSARLIFVVMFKIWPIHYAAHFVLRAVGVRRFKETLCRRDLYLKPMVACKGQISKADSSSAAI